MPSAPWARALRVAAVLFALLALSNLLKPWQLWGSHTGFVLFGRRLNGTANAVIGPLFGFYLLVYAWGLWRQKFFALPLAWAYAVYVMLNLGLFIAAQPADTASGPRLIGLVYAVVAIGVSAGTAVLLLRHRAALQ